MPDLPSGTVTFLFTDIEGSTQRWQQHPAAMPAAVARHERLLREAVEGHGGAVFKTVGDAVCAAFPNAVDAVAAALTAQRALYAEPWGATGPLRVRMALHTGDAQPGAATTPAARATGWRGCCRRGTAGRSCCRGRRRRWWPTACRPRSTCATSARTS